MAIRQLALTSFCLVALLTSLCLWLVSALVPARGQISVGFVGLTNDATGATAALFQLTNGLGRDIGFAAGPIEMQGSEGWPKGSNHTIYVGTHLGPAYKVRAGQTQCFSVSLTNLNSTMVWRVPIVYANIATPMDGWIDKIKVLLRRPGGGVAWETYTPPMVGLSNQPAQLTPR